jgi:twitching motility protein PilI
VREHARLLAFNASFGSHCAVLVDRLAGLRSAGQLTADTATEGARPAFAARSMLDADGRRWHEVDLAALARDEQFLAIAA